jgi:hypothetical protein
MAKLGENPLYKISAYKDPNSTANLSSENIFEVQILNVSEVGTYIIDGTFEEHFGAYARFTTNEAGVKKVYQNKENDDSFVVNIAKFYPTEYSELIGISGSFEGTLYNLENPTETINIKNGEFDLRKINRSTFNQCAE